VTKSVKSATRGLSHNLKNVSNWTERISVAYGTEHEVGIGLQFPTKETTTNDIYGASQSRLQAAFLEPALSRKEVVSRV
jgi:hypothetical protein